MIGVTKIAKKANLRRRSCCNKCPFNTRPKTRCTEEIWNLCSNSFIEGFVKGSALAKNKIKESEEQNV